MKLLSLLTLALAAMSAAPAAAQRMPAGYELHDRNGPTSVVIDGGQISFLIHHGECSDKDYGDGRGESDCGNGNVRANIIQLDSIPINSPVEYRFDVRVEPGLDYGGYKNIEATGLTPDGWDSTLWVASWEGNNLHNFIYHLKLDNRNGLTFLGRTCQAAASFGEWVAVSMKVRWSNDDRGWVQIRCDDRIIHAAEGIASNQPPHCFSESLCEPGKFKEPGRVIQILGPVMAGHGHEWQRYGHPDKFRPIQPEGIAVQMRNVAVLANPAPYSAEEMEKIRGLQLRLAELECDPGPADGISGKRTREAALSCRDFGEGRLPDAFSVMTLDTFVALYDDPAAGDLPPGSLPGELKTVPVTRAVRAAESFTDSSGDAPQFYSEIFASFSARDGNALDARFAIEGQYSTYAGVSLPALLFVEDVGDAGPALQNCGVKVISWPGHPNGVSGIPIATSGSEYRITNTDCIEAALPARLRQTFTTVAHNLDAIAVGLVKSHALGAIKSDGARLFWTEIATGVMTVSVKAARR